MIDFFAERYGWNIKDLGLISAELGFKLFKFVASEHILKKEIKDMKNLGVK